MKGPIPFLRTYHFLIIVGPQLKLWCVARLEPNPICFAVSDNQVPGPRYEYPSLTSQYILYRTQFL